MDVLGRIKQLMADRGWSEYRLAVEAHLSHSTITNLFNRNNTPTFPTLESICAAFGITLTDFFSEGAVTINLTEEQRTLLAKWSALTDAQKQALLQLMGTMR